MKKDCIQSFWFFFEKRTAGQKSNGYFTFGKICNEVYRPNEERSGLWQPWAAQPGLSCLTSHSTTGDAASS